MADTINQLVADIFFEMSGDLRVCMPGRIETYDPDTHLATVQPLLKRKFYGRETSTLLPIISRVPVVHPQSSNAILRLPINEGSLVTLIFTDRSIENWLAGDGAPKDPLDTRRHHLNDAYAIPGGYPEGLPWSANNPDALEIEVKSGTKITIGNGTDELLQLAHDAFSELKDLVSELSQTLADLQLETHQVSVEGAPTGVPLNASSYATTKTAVDAIGTAVDATIASLGNIKV